jgi:NAD(P)-dependent dehydrogenase (short-subunit alcohol dehydrogenase family)
MKAPVVVLDAGNGVGRGVVEAALAASRAVIAVTRDARTLAALRERQHELAPKGVELQVIDGGTQDETAAERLAADLRALERPLAGIVVAHCSDPPRGRVLDQPARELQRRLEADLLPQLAAARHLLPVLSETGRNGGYVVIGSPGTEHPWVGYGYRSIAAAANAMLVRVLHNEARLLGVRVQMLAINRPVRTEENRTCACEGWPLATEIATQALALVDQVESRHPVSALVRFAEATP